MIKYNKSEKNDLTGTNFIKKGMSPSAFLVLLCISRSPRHLTALISKFSSPIRCILNALGITIYGYSYLYPHVNDES